MSRRNRSNKSGRHRSWTPLKLRHELEQSAHTHAAPPRRRSSNFRNISGGHVVGSKEWSEAPLNFVLDMFPDTDPQWVRAVFAANRGNVERTIEQVMQEIAAAGAANNGVAGSSSPSTTTGATGGNGVALTFAEEKCHPDLFSQLPEDVLFVMCEFLEVFSLCRLRRASRACHNVVTDIFKRLHFLNVPRYRHWSEPRISAMMRTFSNTDYLLMRNCKELQLSELPFHVYKNTLTRLNLSGCIQLTDAVMMRILATLPKLADVDVSGTDITNATLECMADLQLPLRRVCLSSCRYITDHGVSRLMSKLPYIQDLRLKNTSVTGSAHFLRSKNVALSTLDLSACRRITSLTLSSCLLRDLKVGSCPLLTHLTVEVPDMQSLKASHCKLLESVHLRTPVLDKLNLSGCRALSTLTVKGNTSLTEVNIFQCKALSGANIRGLAASAKDSLTTMMCAGCLALGDETAQFVMSTCPHLTTFDISACRCVVESTAKNVKSVLADRNNVQNSKNQTDDDDDVLAL